MTEYRVNESKMKEQQHELGRESPRCNHSSHLVLKVVAGAMVGLVAFGVITSLNDIKRYIRMRQM